MASYPKLSTQQTITLLLENEHFMVLQPKTVPFVFEQSTSMQQDIPSQSSFHDTNAGPSTSKVTQSQDHNYSSYSNCNKRYANFSSDNPCSPLYFARPINIDRVGKSRIRRSRVRLIPSRYGITRHLS